jgi:hypothetical protein
MTEDLSRNFVALSHAKVNSFQLRMPAGCFRFW